MHVRMTRLHKMKREYIAKWNDTLNILKSAIMVNNTKIVHACVNKVEREYIAKWNDTLNIFKST